MEADHEFLVFLRPAVLQHPKLYCDDSNTHFAPDNEETTSVRLEVAKLS